MAGPNGYERLFRPAELHHGQLVKKGGAVGVVADRRMCVWVPGGSWLLLRCAGPIYRQQRF